MEEEAEEEEDLLLQLEVLESLFITYHSIFLCGFLFNCYCSVWNFVYRVYCLELVKKISRGKIRPRVLLFFDFYILYIHTIHTHSLFFSRGESSMCSIGNMYSVYV